MIAAVAVVHKSTLVTHNTADFQIGLKKSILAWPLWRTFLHELMPASAPTFG